MSRICEDLNILCYEYFGQIYQAPHTTLTLFYGKFRACVPRIRHLIVEVERRQEQAPEYKVLLQVHLYIDWTVSSSIDPLIFY